MNAIENISQDIRFGIRTLRKNVGFSVLAILTLALGIGANSAIFSVINGVLLQPLPYRNPDEITLLQQHAPGVGRPNLAFSIKEVMEYRDQLATFDSIVEYHSMSFTLLSHGEPDRVLTGVVSHNFFDMLGVVPVHGRTFNADDDRLDADAVLMLSHEYWQQKFGGDPSIVGQVFQMNDRPHEVVGILPPFPQHPRYNDVYMPTVSCPFRANGERNMHQNRNAFRGLNVFGRLAADATLDSANADMGAMAERLIEEFPDNYSEEGGFSADSVLLFEQLTQNARPMLLILLGTSGLVLLIACANVANLTLSRMMRRERELAVRTAMGAGRSRLLGQLVTESTILALAGGALGLVLASQGIEMLSSFISGFTPRVQQIGIDSWVLAFTLGVSVVTGIAFGAIPAFSRRSDLVTSLKDGGAQSTSGGARQRARSALIVAQVAVSFVLLIGAGLLLNSFFKLSNVDPGFNVENVVTAESFPNWTKYPGGQGTDRLFGDILDQLETSPGVTAVATANNLPLLGSFGQPQAFEIEGRPVEDANLRPQVRIQNVSEGYFDAAGVALLAGRTFTRLDNPDGLPIAVVNQSMADANWRGENPVGERVSFDGGENWIEIAGVVGDIRQNGVTAEPIEQIFLPARQTARFCCFLMVRSNADPAIVTQQIRDAVHAADPEQPVENFRTMQEIHSGTLATPRITAMLLGLFAGVAMLITLVGITGVIATSVSQRKQEFGIRMALGAQRGSVLTMVIRQGLMLVGAGLLIGVAGSLMLGQVIAGLLYETAPTDVFTFLAVGAVFVVAGAAACLVPARRATSVDPIVALRAD